RTLLGGVLEALKRNLEHTADVRLFEIGSVYLPHPGEKLPQEPRRLAIALCGKRYTEFWGDGGSTPKGNLDFYDLKGVIERLLADVLLNVTYQPAKEALLPPGKAAAVVAGERVLGVLGELHPRVAEREGFGGKTVLVAELDLGSVRTALPPRYAYQPVSRFPV